MRPWCATLLLLIGLQPVQAHPVLWGQVSVAERRTERQRWAGQVMLAVAWTLTVLTLYARLESWTQSRHTRLLRAGVVVLLIVYVAGWAGLYFLRE